MAGLEPSHETLRRKRNRVGSGDTDRVEAKRLGALDEGVFQRLTV
jgi:hypothetical protein